MSEYLSAGPLNDRERPRVLGWVQHNDEITLLDWAREKSGTFKVVRSLDEVDVREWDVLVTNGPYSRIPYLQMVPQRSRWNRAAEHLFIFRVFSSIAGLSDRYFEFNLTEEKEADTDRALTLQAGVPGHKMDRVSGLAEPIQELVKSDLLPSIERRSKQHGIRPSGVDLSPAVLKLRPFLLGPDGLIMAASYGRPGGRSVWLVPSDATNLSRWFDAAMAEWHRADPRTFPRVSTWHTDPRWDTGEELVARSKLQEIEDNYAKATAQYSKERATARAELDSATAAAIEGPKALLTGQDDSLQNAALLGLRRLGFNVEDMDLVWPERERREDFRIRDADEPGWLVLADATGVAKGAPGSKITTVVGYVTKYVIDEGAKVAPGVWIIVNRLFHRDPMARGEVYRSDDLAVLESHDGLAIDSSALFLLVESIGSASDRAKACRAWLRAARGQITPQDAIDWLTTNP